MDKLSHPIMMPAQTAITVFGEHALQSPADLDEPKWYLNRELSQLEFFRRVLEEAKDESNPLLERVKFLAIVGSNLDEFFMVRVAGLKQQIAAGVVEPSIDGLTPAEQLAAIRKAVTKLLAAARACYQDDLLPKLAEAGIHLLGYGDLDQRQQAYVEKYFSQVIFPVLTPLAFDPGRPFPHISNLSLNLAVLIRDPTGKEHFARVKHGATLALLRLARTGDRGQPGGALPRHGDPGLPPIPRPA
jgi:polyphosphate kinase